MATQISERTRSKVSRVISHLGRRVWRCLLPFRVGPLLPDTLARCEPLPMLVLGSMPAFTVISAGDKKAVTGTKR